MQKKELPRAQQLAERAFANLERFVHIEAVSGIVLLLAAMAALIWANSPAADSYDSLWHTPLTIGVGSLVYSQSLPFWINDGLMTIFFLVVGMEIRREIHEGALSSLRQATLPMAAAVGGVAVPALLYLGFGHASAEQQGWAVPTATDIALAVGVLALLGKSIPSNVRVFLLARCTRAAGVSPSNVAWKVKMLRLAMVNWAGSAGMPSVALPVVWSPWPAMGRTINTINSRQKRRFIMKFPVLCDPKACG